MLGYTDSSDTNITGKKLEKVRKEIHKDIRKWQSKHLNLSLIGKKIIINQAILSKICFLLAYVERPPERIIKNRKNINNFLWNH